MYKISYGLFVVTTHKGNIDNGCITNTIAQVTSEPNQISVTINKTNYTHDLIVETGQFTASIISQEADFELFKHFGFQSGRSVDKFANFTDCQRSSNGDLYITKGTNAYISAEVVQKIDLGTHTLFIGKVSDMEVLSEALSATYEYYQGKIKPQKAGTTSAGKTIWRCRICGYEYVGEELPEDFICPLCKHPASDFEKVTANTEKTTQPTAVPGKTVWRCPVCGYEYEGEKLPEDFICPLCSVPGEEFEKHTLHSPSSR